MIVRKNISIDQCYIDKLKPFLDKNSGNLSAAIRDSIEIASQALDGKNYEKGEDSSKTLKNAESRNKMVEEEEFLLIHHTMLEWFIKKTSGLLIEESIVYELINPYTIKKIPDFVRHVNALNDRMGWRIKVDAECTGSPEPETVILTLSNGNPWFRGILAQNFALYLAKQMKLDVQGLFNRSNVTKIYFKRAEFLNYEKIPKGFEEHFGAMESTFQEIQKRPEIWKNLVKIYRQQNYQRLNMNKKVFEAFVSGNLPSVDDMEREFELLAGKPPEIFTLAEHIMIFKELYLTDSIGSDIEICIERGSEYVKLIHDYSDRKVCERIIQYYSNIFRSIGYPFTVASSPHMIVFEFGKNMSLSHISESGFAEAELEPSFMP
ncbi:MULTISPECIES: hypothetical protein [unclassified Methanosarcina]|uniref:hypothetical protein n=1 Tax=unclassified Methanosarcina TaxID=2644672 RepID=UPI000615AF9A|nr:MULTISPECIES: hypothetical protein [unclassified Methanosarcina]AKB20168.1 hypothetical protein MSWHS_3305 [Methanosarcina sp. WWM596]AKB23367.1 hypothetical protein MSWH1_3096 [Methanosarcina sp. WH1]